MSPQLQGTPQDEQAIRTATSDFVKAWNQHDVKAMTACFSTDADLTTPAGDVARNRNEVEKIINEEQHGMFSTSRFHMPQKHLRFLKPDLALGDYDMEIAGVRGADGKDIQMKGKVSLVMSKHADRWLIAAARAMVPAPRPGTRK
jgi:uncharacterized protein (TIGR02246 family)